MTNIAKLVGATAFLGLAVPVAAQDPYNYPQGQYQPQYPQQYPQQYPGQPVQTQPYPGQQYGYPQSGYGNNSVGQIIDQLLGNRYSVTDRQAIHQCANAAISQSSAQFGGGSGGGYNHPYGYNQQYGYNQFQLTAITDVERRSNGLRVKGLLNWAVAMAATAMAIPATAATTTTRMAAETSASVAMSTIAGL